MAQPSNKLLLIIGAVIIAVVAGYYFMTRPDTRTTGERLDDAISEFSKGADNAAEQMKDRSPADKLKDALRGR